MATESQVYLFLKKFYQYFDKGKIKYRFNKKSTDFIKQFGWTNKRAAKFVRDNISIENYSEGPNSHHWLPNNTVAVFGMQLMEKEMYVKISIDVDEDDCGCMSFHPAEEPIYYPLRGGE